MLPRRSQPFVTDRAAGVYPFAGYALDTIRGALLYEDQELKLRPKSYEALKYLVENRGRLIPKGELMAALWPDATAVSDDSLTHCIMDIRRVLNDDGRQFIRTVAGRGYLFAAPAQVDSALGQPTPAPIPHRRSRRIVSMAAAMAGIFCIAVLSWFVKNRAGQNWARESVPRVEALTAEGKYSEAFELGTKILDRLPGEPRVIRLLNEFSDDLSVSTIPPGAEVSLRRLGSARPERIGVTPINRARIARGEYILSIHKQGYGSFEQTLSTALARSRPAIKTPWDIRIQQELRPASKIPSGMVAVPGGEYKLRGYSRPTETAVKLSDYFIDKFEVSNREFKAFIDAGGYTNRQLWDSRFYDTQLASHGRDKTGLRGPRGWIGGVFPGGKENHPVTGVTWHEAAAYCRFQGKDLPSLFQWEKAARPSVFTPFGVIFPWGLLDPADASKRGNFQSTGTTPVDSFEFGMSPFGVYNMGGNVTEWLRNPYDDGFTTAGGAWNDPIYRWAVCGTRPALYSDESLGFRCVKTAADPAAGDQGAMRFASDGPAFHYPISSEVEFRRAKARYAYEYTPLNWSVSAVEERDLWRREEVAFDGHGAERVKAFLYLPRNAAPPYQVIHFMSGLSWWFGVPVTDVVEDRAARLAPYIRSGRALLLVVLKGFDGRPPVGAFGNLEAGSATHREMLLNWAVDMQRGVDYLESRLDIDSRKIVFWNNSTLDYGAVFAAIEGRYAANILISAGVFPQLAHIPADVNLHHFVPHIRSPKLMLNGLYDDGGPEWMVEAFFRLLRGPKKRASFDGGHIPPAEFAVPVINAFLDETLGPPNRK